MTATGLCFVDASSNNGTPNLTAYADAGHQHVSLKASEGLGYHWPEHDTLTTQAHQVGLRVGHYHWLAEDASPSKQADLFVRLVKATLQPGDWLMTDFEQSSGVAFPGSLRRGRQLIVFNERVMQQLPDYPLFVYTGNWYLDGRTYCQAAVRRYPVIMSDYDPVADDQMPNPYRLQYAARQFTCTATVAGFTGPVDYNRWLEEPMTPAQIQAALVAALKSPDGQALLEQAAVAALQKQPVNVNGLLRNDHQAYPSIEGLLSGVPGYVPTNHRGALSGDADTVGA